MTVLDRVNAGSRVVRTKSVEEALGGMYVRVIPPKAARTARATEASKTRRQAPVEQVAALTAEGKSAAQIGLSLGIGARRVRTLRARARQEAAERSLGTRPET